MAGPSLGQGIALQERLKYDDTPNRVIEQAMYRRQERDRQDEAKLVDALDFKVDYEKYLPVYGNRIAEIQADVYNKHAKYRQEDKATAKQRIQLDILEARKQIGELARSNEALKKDMALGPNFRRNTGFNQLAAGKNTTFEQLNKASHPLGYYSVGPNGEYSSMPIEQFKPDTKYTRFAEEYLPGTKKSDVPGKTIKQKREFVSDEDILAEGVRIAQNPVFQQNLMYDRPDLFTGDKMQSSKNIMDAAILVAKNAATERRSEQLVDLPNPPASSADKKIRPTITRNVEQMEKVLPEGTMKKMNTAEGVRYNYVDKSGKTIGTGKTNDEARNAALKPGTAKVDLLLNLPDAKVMSVRTSPEMIDTDTNNFLENIGTTTNFDFKPTRLQTMRMNDGSLKVYAVGKVVKNVDDTEKGGRPGKEEDAKKTENVYNVAVPYNEIRSGLVDENYDLSEFDAEYEKLVDEKGTKTEAAPRAVNPKTGEVMEYINGKWSPVK